MDRLKLPALFFALGLLSGALFGGGWHLGAGSGAGPPADTLATSLPAPASQGRYARDVRGDARRPPRAGRCEASGIPSKYDLLFRQAARRHLPLVYKTDWCRLKAQCFEESGLDPDAVSQVGAVGACQFMAPTFAQVTRRHGITGGRRNPKANIEAAAAYVAAILEMLYADRSEPCRWRWVAVIYNWGPGRVQRQVWRVYGSPECPAEVWEVLPGETRHYVRRIDDTYELLRAP